MPRPASCAQARHAPESAGVVGEQMGTQPRSRLGVAVVILGLAACYTELGGHYSVHSASPSPIAPQSAPQAPPTATSDDLAAIEKEMAVHPLESFAIARRALDAA